MGSDPEPQFFNLCNRLIRAGSKIGSMTKLSKTNPMMTEIATSISVTTPEGISAAKVPPNITAAEITTPPILREASVIL